VKKIQPIKIAYKKPINLKFSAPFKTHKKRREVGGGGYGIFFLFCQNLPIL